LPAILRAIGGAIVGRPEAPLDAREEPLREFAGRLRRLRDQSGGRSYRQLARSANFAAPTLARAANGRSLPSWEVTRAYVAACGGDPDQWHAMWASTARLLGRDHQPGLAVPDGGQAAPPGFPSGSYRRTCTTSSGGMPSTNCCAARRRPRPERPAHPGWW
jgi:helix-turn-helix protein